MGLGPPRPGPRKAATPSSSWTSAWLRRASPSQPDLERELIGTVQKGRVHDRRLLPTCINCHVVHSSLTCHTVPYFLTSLTLAFSARVATVGSSTDHNFTPNLFVFFKKVQECIFSKFFCTNFSDERKRKIGANRVCTEVKYKVLKKSVDSFYVYRTAPLPPLSAWRTRLCSLRPGLAGLAGPRMPS